jgi:hypothetical protein
MLCCLERQATYYLAFYSCETSTTNRGTVIYVVEIWGVKKKVHTLTIHLEHEGRGYRLPTTGCLL